MHACLSRSGSQDQESSDAAGAAAAPDSSRHAPHHFWCTSSHCMPKACHVAVSLDALQPAVSTCLLLCLCLCSSTSYLGALHWQWPLHADHAFCPAACLLFLTACLVQARPFRMTSWSCMRCLTTCARTCWATEPPSERTLSGQSLLETTRCRRRPCTCSALRSVCGICSEVDAQMH